MHIRNSVAYSGQRIEEYEILDTLANKHKCNICMQLSVDMQNEKGVYFSNSELVSMLQKENTSKITYTSIGDGDIKKIIEYLNPIISLKYNKIYGLKWSYHFCPYNDKIKIYISEDCPYIYTTDDKGRSNHYNECPSCNKFAGFNDEYNFCLGSIDC